MNDSNCNIPKLITVPRWKEYHSWPPEGGLRHLIFNSKARPNAPGNGLEEAGVIVRVGRRVLIDEEKFFECVKKQNPTDGKE